MPATIPQATPSVPSTSSQARLQQLLPQLFQPETRSGVPFLKFQLTPDLPALLALDQVQETLMVPGHMITPIPNLPATVVGWMNTRNQVLCVVDLPQFLHFEPAVGNHQRYPVIITRFASPSSANPSSANLANPASDQVMLNAQAPPISQVLLLGLVVHQIRGVERLDREQITSPIAKFPESFTPFLQGCVFQPEGTIPVLQMDAIAAASSLQQVMT